jgi:hypothetical protein
MKIWRHSPYVAVIAVLALAMGIGFTTTMFSIVHGATRPLPFHDAHEIVAIDPTVDAAGFRRWRDAARSYAALAAFETVSMNLADAASDPERINGAAITPNAFALLGVTPMLGRSFGADDAQFGTSPVVVLSHRLWRQRFNSDRAIVGKSIRLTGVPHGVVGVMPERFGFPVNAAFWIPLAVDLPATQPVRPSIRVFGRLADGVSMETSQAELDAIAAAANIAVDSASGRRDRIDVMPFSDIETPREIIRGLYLLVVAVSFVLLIACANVANLLIARAAVRTRDVALRLALGATRRQLVREQLAETLSLAVVAMFLGVLFANAGTRVFASNTAHIIEAFWVDFRVDGIVLIFASLLAGIATMAAGLGPALRVARSNVADVLKDRAAGSSGLAIGRFSRVLMPVQIALACGLLALTMVLARSAVNIRSVPWTFDPSSVLTFEFEAPERVAERVGDGGPSVAGDLRPRPQGDLRPQPPGDPRPQPPRDLRPPYGLREIADALNSTTGVRVAALTTSLPGRGNSSTFSLDAPAATPADGATTAVAFVTPEFFAVTRARVHRGRPLTWQDDATAPRVVVVNESFVRRFSADADVMGRRVFFGKRDFTIVGVVSDAMAHDVQERAQDGIYAPILQARPYGIRVMIEGAGDDAMAMMPAVRETLRRIDPDMPVTEVFTLREAVYRDKRALDVLSALFSIFGLGALTLTAIGLYGVISFTVAQRTRELGIRMAIGATRANVLRIVVAHGARQLVIGLAIGVLLAMGLSRGFAAAVEQLPPADAPLLGGICVALGATVMTALAIPARRAVQLDVMQALRRD